MTQSIRDIAGDQTDIAQLTENERYRLLSSERRRVALRALEAQSTPISLDSLAEAVAAREEKTVAQETIERVKLSLHHNHLPKMDYLSVIDYDPDAQQIE